MTTVALKNVHHAGPRFTLPTQLVPQVTALVEIGNDLAPGAVVLQNPVVVRRLQLFADEDEMPRANPDGSTTVSVRLPRELIPAAEDTLHRAIRMGDLSEFSQATVTALGMVEVLAKALVENDYYPFFIEPTWARTLGAIVQEVTGRVPLSRPLHSVRTFCESSVSI